MLDKLLIDQIIMTALKEDMPLGDITTDNTIDEKAESKAVFIAKADGIAAGLGVAERVFKILDDGCVFDSKVEDGSIVKKGDLLAEISGRSRALLKAERTSLNLLQRMSGIATLTGRYCDIVNGLQVRIADTRKTVPGLRILDKYAVKMGGGSNHRYSLSDGVLIKDNHIKAAGGIRKAIETVRRNIPHTIKIEVETETLEQVREALESKADIIMLDNMDLETMAKAVALIDHRAVVEASGNVNMETVLGIAKTGVDIISIGELTHSVKGLDISMRFI